MCLPLGGAACYCNGAFLAGKLLLLMSDGLVCWQYLFGVYKECFIRHFCHTSSGIMLLQGEQVAV